MSLVTAERMSSTNAGSCWNLGMSDAGCRLSIEAGIAGEGADDADEEEEPEYERSMSIA